MTAPLGFSCMRFNQVRNLTVLIPFLIKYSNLAILKQILDSKQKTVKERTSFIIYE